MPRGVALAMLGTNQRVITRTKLQRERETVRRRRRRIDRMFRRAMAPPAPLLTPRERSVLYRRLLVDGGFAGVLGDAGLTDAGGDAYADVTPEEGETPWASVKRGGFSGPARNRAPKRDAKKKTRSRIGRRSSNPTRVRNSPTGRTS